MNKKSIIILVSIIVMVIIFTIFIFMNRILPLNRQSDFKTIYKEASDISNLEISINNISKNNKTLIKNKDDVENIMNNIKDVKIKKISNDDVLLGGYARLIITNTKNGNSINIAISSSQISIGNHHYRTDENVLGKIKDILYQYDSNSIM